MWHTYAGRIVGTILLAGAMLGVIGTISIVAQTDRVEASPLLEPQSPIYVNETFTKLALGASHSCALTLDNQVYCWGDNSDGQLGDGTYTDRHIPTLVTGVSNAVDIAAGAYHTCLETSLGEIKCWGQGIYGQLGNGATADSPTPVTVSGISGGVNKIEAGQYHTCALIYFAVECWGFNTKGQVGIGIASTQPISKPVTVIADKAYDVSVGDYHICVVRSNGISDWVECWGSNINGQLGIGLINSTVYSLPVTVSGLPSSMISKKVEVGYVHTCVMISTVDVRCWGSDINGQLGNNTTGVFSKPVSVQGLPAFNQLAAGGFHNCIRVTTYTIYC